MDEIINNQKIARSKSPILANEKQYTKSISTIVTLNDIVISQAIKEEDYPSCSSLLNQLQASIKNANYGTYSINKKHYYYHLFVCFHNYALVFQQKNENIQARNYMEKAISNYQKLQGYITNREENVVFMMELVKLQLQHCGLLSHCDMHLQAAALSQKSLDRIMETARILQAICYEQALLNAQTETTSSSRQKRERNEMVDFKSVVIEQAESILQQITQLQPPHKLIAQDKHHFQNIINNIFSWKENQANNQAALKRQLKINKDKSSRNILGLQKQSAKNEFEIGGLMILHFKTIAYSPHADPLRLLSSHSLKCLAFYSSLSYFTIATQTRFGESDLSEIRGNMKIDEKYKKLNHDERLLKCKILHIKALQVAGKLLSCQSALFGHLCQSFGRNYKFVMDEINEVSEMNSTNTIRFIPDKKVERQQSGVVAQYGIRITPRMTKKHQKNKIEKSGSKKGDRRISSSKSQNKLRSSSFGSKK